MTTLSSDTFNRANGATVATRLGSTDGGALGPLLWTKGFAGLETEGLNLALTTVANGGNDISTPHAYHIAYVELGRAAVDLSIDVNVDNQFGKSAGLLLRYTSDSNFWSVQWAAAGSQINLYKMVAGTETLVASTVGSLGLTGTLRVVATGPTINIYQATTLLATVTDSFNATATKHGIAMRNDPAGTLNASSLDNWSAQNPPVSAIFPTLIVNVGFLAASNAAGTGPYMTFNDAVNGKFDTGEFAPDYQWLDIASDVRSCTITRGRQRQIEAFPAGTCSLVIDNNAGNYDPDNPNSTLFQGGVTTVLPMRPVQILAEWGGTTYPLFYGYIDQIMPSYEPGKFSDAWCTITASDAMKVLQNIPSSGANAPAEASGTRVGRILDGMSWPATLRTIAAGDLTLQATTLAATVGQDIQTSVDSEYGRWYIGAEGNVIFESRSQRNYDQTVASTWSDTDTNGYIYSSLQRMSDDDLIRNRVSIQNVGGTAQVVTDSASQTQYQVRSFSSSGLLLQSDFDAYELALLILYLGKQNFGTRFPEIMFEPIGDPQTMWPEMLTRAISDHVAVVVTPPYVSPMTLGGYIEGVSHTITSEPVQDWTVSFHVSRAPVSTQFFLFDNATYGRFDQANVFSY